MRANCAGIASHARHVAIHADVPVVPGGVEGLDATLHFLAGDPEETARYVFVLDAINFGSGWFHSLELAPGETGTSALTARLTAHARAHDGTWTAAELRRLDARTVAAVLGQAPEHPLIALYAEALRQLGTWLGERTALEAIAAADGSGQRLAAQLAAGMPFLADAGFYKRAQITANDLVHAGAAEFSDIDSLTVFADNLLPHVLRADGVLTYSDELARLIDAGALLPAGGDMERELRGSAVHACELIATRLGVPPRTLDNWLWNRGEGPPYNARPAHRTETVFY